LSGLETLEVARSLSQSAEGNLIHYLLAQKLVDPYEGKADAVLAGAKRYRHHCAECHGPGWGTERAANLHASDVQKATPGEVEWFLGNGNLLRGMPSWSGLPEQRRWQIVSYLKTLR
jgi:mono/diheme cytochrome c family protein